MHSDAVVVSSSWTETSAGKAMRTNRRIKAKQELMEIAIHEAGHAVAAYLFGLPLESISIVEEVIEIGESDFRSNGRVWIADNGPAYPPATEHQSRTNRAIVILSGYAAMSIHFIKEGDENGEATALIMAKREGLHGDWEKAKYIEGGWSCRVYDHHLPPPSSVPFQESRNVELFDMALKILRKPNNWRAVKSLASELMVRQEIAEPGLSALIRTAIKPPKARSRHT